MSGEGKRPATDVCPSRLSVSDRRLGSAPPPGQTILFPLWEVTIIVCDEWLDYTLPADLIAQHPLPRRVDARLLVVDRASESLEHWHVRDLPELLRRGDRLVVNDTRVVPASLRGVRQSTGGRWQGLFLGTADDGCWKLVCKTRGTLREPEAVVLEDRDGRRSAILWLLKRLEGGVWLAKPDSDQTALSLLDRVGRTPLPPYIRGGNMSDEDEHRYQTVFARQPGAVAAPTAGLHFTPQLLRSIERAGVTFSSVTLHVGQGTFQPLSSDNPDQHKMHAEWGELTETTSSEIAATHAAQGRVVAVGTTVVRVLETAASQLAAEGGGELSAWRGETDLFIRPGFSFRAVDALLTNFHFPRTTLLLLVQAFGGSELMRRAYEEAITREYRFYSYGDAMLIV